MIVLYDVIVSKLCQLSPGDLCGDNDDKILMIDVIELYSLWFLWFWFWFWCGPQTPLRALHQSILFMPWYHEYDSTVLVVCLLLCFCNSSLMHWGNACANSHTTWRTSWHVRALRERFGVNQYRDQCVRSSTVQSQMIYWSTILEAVVLQCSDRCS